MKNKLKILKIILNSNKKRKIYIKIRWKMCHITFTIDQLYKWIDKIYCISNDILTYDSCTQPN